MIVAAKDRTVLHRGGQRREKRAGEVYTIMADGEGDREGAAAAGAGAAAAAPILEHEEKKEEVEQV